MPEIEYNQAFNTYLFWIRKSAKKIAEQFHNKVFTVDELVNEAWIRGIDSNRPNKSEFVQRAYWDMKDYVREEIGREGAKNQRPRLITNLHNDDEDNQLHILDKYVLNEDIKRIDNSELLTRLLGIPNKRNLDIINSYYIEEKSLKDVGIENNIAESSTCNILKKTIKKIQECSEMEQYEYCDI